MNFPCVLEWKNTGYQETGSRCPAFLYGLDGHIRSIFLISAFASARTASNLSSGASSTIFWPRKLTDTFVTPSIFFTAFWILSAQCPQSRSISLMVFSWRQPLSYLIFGWFDMAEQLKDCLIVHAVSIFTKPFKVNGFGNGSTFGLENLPIGFAMKNHFLFG